MPLKKLRSKIGIVGGGNFCEAFLRFVFENNIAVQPEIIGVADVNQEAPGLRYAKSKGIFTTSFYTELYQLAGLEAIMVLVRDFAFMDFIKKWKPGDVKLIDYVEASCIWDTLQIEHVRKTGLDEIEKIKGPPETIDLYNKISDRYFTIIQASNNRSRKIERELIDQERSQYQIIQGSTIPTFVINRDHKITHWNKAMEKLTDIHAEEVLGTDKQWMPFYGKERLTMADVILDQVEVTEIQKLYANWRKSALIEGAYEAEGFFPRLGENGKWCWFTAAPIKAPDGRIIGAIETFWDKTEDKKAEEERERRTRELGALCEIYTSLNAPLSLNVRMNAVMAEIKDYLSIDSICIFFLGKNQRYQLEYCLGLFEDMEYEKTIAGEDSFVAGVAKIDKLVVVEELDGVDNEEIKVLRRLGLKSLAYVPISAKERKGLGVMRIGSALYHHFGPEERRVLELIGNRIGAAIENAVLQEQYIRSEEKYRSLFNNDPNPIFILEAGSFTILDTNRRAQDCYGYSRKELFGFPFLELGEKKDRDVENGLKNMSAGKSVLFSKKRHFKKGGDPFYVNINVSVAKYLERDVLIATTTDITEYIEKETQLIQAGKMATLGVMAAGMAHEINQPLNVIQICADFFLKMLSKGKSISDDDLRSMATDIVENVERATGVIRHVRDFARQSEVVKNKVAINGPIEDVFKVLGHQLKAHQVELELALDPDIPPIMAEHNRLEQVFINLVSNALDAMDEKCALPDCENFEKRLKIESLEENGKVVVNVSDTGIGMTPETKKKILEPFFTTKKVGKGTGLGVSISYGIIRDYEGEIEVESEYGKGTTFRLKFPVAGDE